MALAGRPKQALALLALCALTGACAVHESMAEPLFGLEVTEEYGDEASRSVTVAVEIGQDAATALELNHVKLAVVPTSPHSLNKLESQLGESSLLTGEPHDWPETLLRPVPQAVPVINRIQTALVILRPADVLIERASVNLFERPASVGFTRLETRGSAVSMATVALTSIDGKAVTALATVAGSRTLGDKPTDHGFTLQGKRWILGESAERLRVSGRTRSADVPARSEEKTVER